MAKMASAILVKGMLSFVDLSTLLNNMDATGELAIFNGKLTILVAFGHGGELDKTRLKKLLGSDVITERWNKPIELEQSEGVAVIVAGNEKITCNANIYTDIFIAGVSILRTEIEIRDRILFNDILVALHSNTIIVEGLDLQSFASKKITEIREKLNPGKTSPYYQIIKKYTILRPKDFIPKLDQKSLKEHYGEMITRFLSGETSIRALHSKEIMEKLSNDLSYYDEDLFLASTEGVLVIGCEDYIKELRELLELSISLLLLFQIYDRKIDVEITNAFEAIKKLSSSRYYFMTQAPRKLEKSLLKVSDYEKVVEHKIDSLQELYTTARAFSTEQLTLLLEVLVALLILWEVIKPILYSA